MTRIRVQYVTRIRTLCVIRVKAHCVIRITTQACARSEFILGLGSEFSMSLDSEFSVDQGSTCGGIRIQHRRVLLRLVGQLQACGELRADRSLRTVQSRSSFSLYL